MISLLTQSFDNDRGLLNVWHFSPSRDCTIACTAFMLNIFRYFSSSRRSLFVRFDIFGLTFTIVFVVLIFALVFSCYCYCFFFVVHFTSHMHAHILLHSCKHCGLHTQIPVCRSMWNFSISDANSPENKKPNWARKINNQDQKTKKKNKIERNRSKVRRLQEKSVSPRSNALLLLLLFLIWICCIRMICCESKHKT